MSRGGGGLSGRSTVEVMILLLTGTVCISLLFTGVAVVLAEIFNPELDTMAVAGGLTNVLSALVGALLGVLAGRTDGVRAEKLRRRLADEQGTAAGSEEVAPDGE